MYGNDRAWRSLPRTLRATKADSWLCEFVLDCCENNVKDSVRCHNSRIVGRGRACLSQVPAYLLRRRAYTM